MKWTKTIGIVALFAAFSLSAAMAEAAKPLPGGTLDPTTIPQFVTPLVIPPEMPASANPAGFAGKYYEIAVRPFEQQILPAGFPKTRVFGYGSVNPGSLFHYPSLTIEAAVDEPVRVKWINDLKDSRGNYLPPFLPIDQTLHWANPRGPIDMRGTDPNPYTGPIPISVHLHGGHMGPESDGHPESWFLPDARNVDCKDDPPMDTRTTADDFYCRGSQYGAFLPSPKGAAILQYPNDQRATTLWYHDHALGMTRINVQQMNAGFYLLRGGDTDLPSGVPGGLPGPSPKIGEPAGTRYYEIPLAIQDRSFNTDGSFFYPTSRAFFDGYAGPYVGGAAPSDIAPIWNPEEFGNVMIVNGKTWPYLNVEPRKYRLRLLNGTDSRTLILKMSASLSFTQIGAEGGFLPTPVVLNEILLGPAERADIVVDFSKFVPGDQIMLLNYGPDAPFGGLPVPRRERANPATTGKVMLFKVIPLAGPDMSAIPELPARTPLGDATYVRKVSLNEAESSVICVDANNVYVPGMTPPCGILPDGTLAVPLAPLMAQLGTVDLTTGLGIPLAWDDPVTEDPDYNATEIWEIYNFTADTHPIHVHLVQFEVVNREDMANPGVLIPPRPAETGTKDTVMADPGQITRIKAKFDIRGPYVWHCHIISHEDHEMMREYEVR